MAGLAGGDADRLVNSGFQIHDQFNSVLLDSPVARIIAPRGLSPRRALARVRALVVSGTATRNDFFNRTRTKTYETEGTSCGTSCPHFGLTAWHNELGRCMQNVSIGVIDTGVDVEHPSLRLARIEARTTRRKDRAASDRDHGTGVVSLMAGSKDSEVVGLVEGVRILAADAFHRQGSVSLADVFDVIASLDWLARERVQIVNLSFSGPDNELLERAIRKAQAAGMLLIAAAGPSGSGKSQGYPGRYEGVVAVAAVDGRLRPSRLSMRGAHIAFAAPGVGLVVAANGGKLRQVDGTSFAAPFVASAYAIALGGRKQPAEATQLLSVAAKDLGAPGRDSVYGWGVVQYSRLPRC